MLKHYIREHGNGAYVVGEDTDTLWDPNTCVEVPQRPTILHRWNNNEKKWTINIEDKRRYVRGMRNIELKRTDKFLVSDFPITPENKNIAMNYRQQLRDLPSKQTIEELEMPVCPAFMVN